MALGKKTGGRKKGARNKATTETAKAVADSGLTPLAYMLQVMRDPLAEPERRDDMAKAAAPYSHNRLSAIEHTGKDGGAVEHKVTGIVWRIVDPRA